MHLDETSVLLIKPDGFRSGPVRRIVDASIAANDLSILWRYSLLLRYVDVLDIWPKFNSDKYRILRELNARYMTSDISEVIIVRGTSAAARCAVIKGKVRKHFGAGMFGNMLHCPIGASEIEATVHKLFHSVPNGTPFTRSEYDAEAAGIWGELAAFSLDEIRAVTGRVWDLRDRAGWEAVRCRRKQTGRVTLHLIGGDPMSIDFGMSVLCETFPEWTLEDVVRTYLEADVFGQARLTAGDPDEMAAISRAIRQYGLFTRLGPSEPP